MCKPDEVDFWFRYQPATSGLLLLSLCDSDYDTAVSVHTGCPATVANEVGCNDNACDFQSQLTVPVQAGSTYMIRIAGRGQPSRGRFDDEVRRRSNRFVLELNGPVCTGDCNANGILDECEFANGLESDCNHNGIPDSCEPQFGEPTDCLIEQSAIVWSAAGSIHRTTADGRDLGPLVTVSRDPQAVTTDSSQGMIYWVDVDASTLYRVRFDGTLHEVVARGAENLGGAPRLAFDDVHQTLYGSDFSRNRIYRIDLTLAAPAVTTIIADEIERPFGLAIDAEVGKIYWAVDRLGKIQRANLDGSAIEDVVTGLVEPVDVAVHPRLDRLYWIDRREAGAIYAAHRDGSEIRVLIPDAGRANALTIDRQAGKLYWSVQNRVARANLDGTNVEPNVIPPQNARVAGLAIVNPTRTLGDVDRDGDVDVADYLTILNCRNQAGQPVAPECAAADLDADGDVDLADVIQAQTLLTGAR